MLSLGWPCWAWGQLWASAILAAWSHPMAHTPTCHVLGQGWVGVML